jgi:pyruvate/oxaloacetate carboxyltransferase
MPDAAILYVMMSRKQSSRLRGVFMGKKASDGLKTGMVIIDEFDPYEKFEKAKAKLGSLAQNDTDVLSYIAFPVIAEKFLQKREESKAVTVSYKIVECKEDGK